jgi:hypothetical protein
MGKWLAGLAPGLAATIIGGVIVVWLTRPNAAPDSVALPTVSTSGTVDGRQAAGAQPAPSSSQPDGRQGQPETGGSVDTRQVPPVEPHPANPRGRYSRTLQLHDGEQDAILDGQVSVGADFTRVGEMEVPTLHVTAPGKDVANHAILNAGERFEIEVSGQSYSLYVTQVDAAARTVSLRIEQQQ